MSPELEDRPGEGKPGEGKPEGWRTVAGQAEQDDSFEGATRLGAEWRAKANTGERRLNLTEH